MTVINQNFTFQAVTNDDLVGRLQGEKKVLLNKVRQEGYELGIRSSSKLSEKDFRHFERVMPLAQGFDEYVLAYLWKFLDRKQYPKQARLGERDTTALLAVDPQSRIIFVQGWLEGVLSIWKNQKDKVVSETLVETLQIEKKAQCQKVRQEGYELGIRSSSKLSYADFQHFERVMPLARAFNEEVLDYLWMFLDRKQYSQQARLSDRDVANLLEEDSQSRILFAQGWLEGVLSIWENLKDQV